MAGVKHAVKYVYVVAAGRAEAEQLACFGSDSRTLAEAHLRECQAPPTDHFYGNRLRIYRVPWTEVPEPKVEDKPPWE